MVSVGVYFSGYKERREELVLDHIHLWKKLCMTQWTGPLRLLGPFLHVKNTQHIL